MSRNLQLCLPTPIPSLIITIIINILHLIRLLFICRIYNTHIIIIQFRTIHLLIPSSLLRMNMNSKSAPIRMDVRVSLSMNTIRLMTISHLCFSPGLASTLSINKVNLPKMTMTIGDITSQISSQLPAS